MGRRICSASLAIVTAASLATLSGCALLPQRSFEDSETIDGTVTSVRFDAESGSITIVGVDDLDEVTIRSEFRYRFDLPAEDSYRLVDGELVLEDCGPQCSVSYRVEVPAGIPVAGITTNGALDLSNLGDLDVETSNGRITLDEIDGAVLGRTSNGRIEGRELRGRVEVESSNGSIELSTNGQADVTARTSNGGIDLTVPDGEYRVDMSTSNGSTHSEVGNESDADVHLDLSTSNGSISVARE